MPPAVLVTDGSDAAGQSRTALWTVRALAAAGYEPVIATTDGNRTLAASSRYVRTILPLPDGEAYGHELTRLAASGRFLTTMPTSDHAVLALHPELAPLMDKEQMSTAVEQAGLMPIPSVSFPSWSALRAARDTLRYPAIVKPRLGHGAFVVRSPGDPAWEMPPQDASGWLAQPRVRGAFTSIAGVMWHGHLLSSVHQRFIRTWPPDAGMATRGITTAPDLALEAGTERLLRHVDGVFEIDLIGGHVIDVNPRVYASLSLALRAGVNLPGIVCDVMREEPVMFSRAQPGHYYRWLDADMRTTAADAREGRITRAQAVRRFFPPHLRTARGGPESFADPRPMLARLLHGVRSRASA